MRGTECTELSLEPLFLKAVSEGHLLFYYKVEFLLTFYMSGTDNKK